MLFRSIRSASWLSRVSENMLSVTRLRDGDVRLAPEVQVLEEIVSGAVLRFRRFQQDIPICLSVPEEILLVRADATLVEQVILNLFENAAIHGKGAAEIRVTLSQDGQEALTRVEDDGQGFPEELLPHLFDGLDELPPLGNGDSTGNSKMGIGLSSCAVIIRAHHGHITGGNLPRGGAWVEFTLPLADSEISGETEQKKEVPGTGADEQAGG